jgi:hypothetical protein
MKTVKDAIVEALEENKKRLVAKHQRQFNQLSKLENEISSIEFLINAAKSEVKENETKTVQTTTL